MTMWCIICGLNRQNKLEMVKYNDSKHFTPCNLEHAYKLYCMSNLCKKTKKWPKYGYVVYVLEIAKNNFFRYRER